MQEAIALICSSPLLVIIPASFAIAFKYPGLINIKFLGAEITTDGRPIQSPAVKTKSLKGK